MDQSNYFVTPVFPEAAIYTTFIDVDSNNIFNYCKNLNFEYIDNLLMKEGDSYISINFNIFNDLFDLKNKIKEHVDTYLYKLMTYKMKYKFLNSWATKTNFKGFSRIHTHNNTFLSGVYYPKGNKNFKIKFHKKQDSFWNIEIEKFNEFSNKTITYTIEHDNTLLLFPSDLLHNIESNDSSIDRYSIAFNINPSGYIGEKDSGVIF
jgi:uncharacterized protein (TIGR02466 family)